MLAGRWGAGRGYGVAAVEGCTQRRLPGIPTFFPIPLCMFPNGVWFDGRMPDFLWGGSAPLYTRIPMGKRGVWGGSSPPPSEQPHTKHGIHTKSIHTSFRWFLNPTQVAHLVVHRWWWWWWRSRTDAVNSGVVAGCRATQTLRCRMVWVCGHSVYAVHVAVPGMPATFACP